MEEFFNSKDEKKEAICECFYDLYIQPRYMQECDNREETAHDLERFLNAAEMSFDEFIETIWEYSLGCGLDYMKDLNEYIRQHYYEQPFPINDYIEF